jgi:hypothetical protein
MSRQPDLFSAPPPPVAAPEPNLPFRRKALGRYLRELRDAEFLPWTPFQTERLTTHFPALASALPDEERDRLVGEFFQHLDRLGFQKAA